MAGIVPWHGDLRRGKDILSRPIIGHTPRKLPAGAAISRIIAVLPGSLPSASFNNIPYIRRLVKGFLCFLKVFRFCRFRTGCAGASGRCRADSPAAGQAGMNRGLRPRTPGHFSGGYAPPSPRVLFARAKSTQKHAKTKVLESFVQSDFIILR